VELEAVLAARRLEPTAAALVPVPVAATTLATNLFFTRRARAANASVHSVSGASSTAGDTIASRMVRALPPRQSLRA
jgi:hypothetical protein